VIQIRQFTLKKTEYGKEKLILVSLLQESKTKFHVITSTGEEGRELREHSHTPFGETLEKAESIFSDFISSHERRGFEITKKEDSDIQEKEATPTATPIQTIDEDSPSEAFKTKEPEDSKAKAIRTRLKYPNEIPNTKWPLSRILWRAGQLKLDNLHHQIAPLIPELNELEANAAVWSLLRSPSENHTSLAKEISIKFSNSKSIQRYLSNSN